MMGSGADSPGHRYWYGTRYGSFAHSPKKAMFIREYHQRNKFILHDKFEMERFLCDGLNDESCNNVQLPFGA